MKSLARGQRASGDLIPWTVSQQVCSILFTGATSALRPVLHLDVYLPDLSITFLKNWNNCSSVGVLCCSIMSCFGLCTVSRRGFRLIIRRSCGQSGHTS